MMAGPVALGVTGCLATALAMQVFFWRAGWDRVDALWIPLFTTLRILTNFWHVAHRNTIQKPRHWAVICQKCLEMAHVVYSGYIRTAVMIPAWESQLQGLGVWVLTALVAMVDQALLEAFAPVWLTRALQVVHGIGGAGCILLQHPLASAQTRVIVLVKSVILMAVLPEMLSKLFFQGPSRPSRPPTLQPAPNAVEPTGKKSSNGSSSACSSDQHPQEASCSAYAAQAPVAPPADCKVAPETPCKAGIDGASTSRGTNAGAMASPPRKVPVSSFEPRTFNSKAWLNSQTDASNSLTGQVIASPPAMTARPVPSVYKSHLGSRIKVCIKLKTNMPLSSLPPDLADVMTRELSQMPPAPGRRLIDMGARSGCIMLTFDCIDLANLGAAAVQPTPDTTTTSHQPAVTDTGAGAGAAHQLASVLLPIMTPLLDHSSRAHSAAGQAHALIQVGSSLWAASCGASDNVWLVQPAGHELNNDDCITASLKGRGSFASPTLTAASCWFGAVRQAWPATVAQQTIPITTTTSTAAAAQPAQNRLCIEAQMLGDVQQLARAVGWQPGDQHHHHAAMAELSNTAAGMTPASTAVVTPETTAVDSDTGDSGAEQVAPLQLLVSHGGQFFPTQVVVVQSSSTEDDDDNNQGVVQVVVDVPDRSLPRHHEGGTHLGFLPVEVQLWRGEILLSTASLMLTINNTASGTTTNTASTRSATDNTATTTASSPGDDAVPASTTATAGDAVHCWWWGTSPEVLHQALVELQQLDTALWESQLGHELRPRFAARDDMLEYIHSHHVFMRDLATWLSGVRDVTQHAGLCCVAGCDLTPQDGSLPATKLSTPELPLDVLTQLGVCLAQHAAALDLHHVQHMIQQQVGSIEVGSPVCGTAASGFDAAGGEAPSSARNCGGDVLVGCTAEIGSSGARDTREGRAMGNTVAYPITASNGGGIHVCKQCEQLYLRCVVGQPLVLPSLAISLLAILVMTLSSHAVMHSLLCGAALTGLVAQKRTPCYSARGQARGAS